MAPKRHVPTSESDSDHEPLELSPHQEVKPESPTPKRQAPKMATNKRVKAEPGLAGPKAPPRQTTSETKKKIATEVVELGRKAALAKAKELAEETGLTVKQVRDHLLERSHIYRELHDCAKNIK